MNYSITPILPQYSIHLPPRQPNELVSLPGGVLEWIDHLFPELKEILPALNSWWLPWLQIQFNGQPARSELITLKEAGFITEVQPGVWIPFSQLIRQLHSENLSQPGGTVITRIRALAAWLAQQGEWLESIRYTLKPGILRTQLSCSSKMRKACFKTRKRRW